MYQPTPTRPLTVILDTTERCNLKCRMCYFSATDRLRFPPHDLELSPNGMMPVDVFDRIATELFPRAWRVALACAAEPLLHPRFEDLVRIAGKHRVPDLWFPTNLLALTESKAEAICQAGVRTVGVSIDGTHAETYESIRVGGRFARLEEKLELFNRVRRARGGKTGLRIIFTWMKTNRADLRSLPAFAERWGADELDVRFVAPTTGVDVGPELLDGEDPELLRQDLEAAAHDAVKRGLVLASYPDFEKAGGQRGYFAERRRTKFRRKAGLDRPEYDAYRELEAAKGCVWPGDFFVIRPNGAVSPCIFWDGDPIAYFPRDDFDALAEAPLLEDILRGLVKGEPIGTCTHCSQRRDALYYRLRAPEGETETAAPEAELVGLGKPS
jgi:MoaA/NifB/PqqE/SkfB family radical SAM enzyme